MLFLGLPLGLAPRPVVQVLVPAGPLAPLSLWEKEFQAAVPFANATKTAAQCRSSRPCRCKVLGECEQGMDTAPTGRFPLHSPAHYCKVYSLCGDMLPMHLRPAARSIVKDRAQKPPLDPLAAAKKAADEARENAEAMAAANANAAEKEAADGEKVAAANANVAEKQAAEREEATKAKLADAETAAADSAAKAAEATAEAKARDEAVRKDAADTAATATAVPTGEPAQAPVAEEADYADAGVGTVAPPVPAYSAPAPSGSDASKAAGEPVSPAYNEPAPFGSDASKAAAEPAASPAADGQICWSTRKGVTDEWCMGMVGKGTKQAMCECGNAADRPTAKPADIVPIDPNHASGDKLTDW